MSHDAVPVRADELARLRECELRCAWLLPIVTGEDSQEVNEKTLAIAQALAIGLTGNDAVDAARKVVA